MALPPLRRAGWLLYQAGMAGALLAAAPWLLARRGRHYAPTFAGRLGRRFEAAPPGGLWIHAVSVGEVGVAATLARALPPALPLVVTTVTPTGQERARAAFAARREAGTAAVAYLPFDVGFAVDRFYRCYAPRALVLVEGDFWPLLLERAARRRLPVAVVNGRVGERSYRRLRALRPLLGAYFDPVDRFGVQTAEDRDRLLTLGVDAARVTVTGNLKYETAEPPANAEVAVLVAAAAAGRPVVVAGSTMPGEEEQALDAWERTGGGGRALLVLAPRHPERWPAVAELLAARGVAWRRRSDAAAGGGRVDRVDVLLLDTLGELAGLYRHAAVAFVGGTLVPTGGHNPLEPARFGVPVVVGESMHNFREIAADFDAAAAWRRAPDAATLATILDHLLADPTAATTLGRRGADLVARNRGALARTLELLEPLLAAVAEGRPA